MTGLNPLGFLADVKGQLCKVSDGLHLSPRIDPSRTAKLCTNSALFETNIVSAPRSLEDSAIIMIR